MAAALVLPAIAVAAPGGNGGGGNGSGGGGKKGTTTTAPTTTAPTTTLAPTTTVAPTTTTVPPSAVDLALTVTDDPDPYLADVHPELVFTDVVVNGATPATRVGLDHDIPTSLWDRFVGVTTTRGSCTPVTDANWTTAVRCDFGDLAPGAQVTVTVRLQACNELGTYTTTARVHARESDSDPLDDVDAEETAIVGRQLVVCPH